MFREFLKNKDLIFYSVKAELKAQMSQMMFGYLWWILDPVLYMAVYTILVVVIFNRGGADYPIFLFCSLVPWKWTITSLTDCVASITNRAGLINQIKVDTSIFPIIKVLSNFFKFCFGLALLLIAVFFYNSSISITWLYLIPVIATQFLFIIGTGFILANLGVYYKDVNNILQFFLRLWFYLSPGLWAIESFPARYKVYLLLNPMTTFFTSYRNILLNNAGVDLFQLLFWAVVSMALIKYGWCRIKKNEGNYPKVV